MQTRFAWKDYAIGVGLLVILFILVPVGLWQFSLLKDRSNKEAIEAVVPAIIEEAHDRIVEAAGVLIREVTSTQDYYTYQRTTTDTRNAIDAMCREISAAIARHPDFRDNQYFCSLYIRRGNSYITANRHNVNVTDYEFDIKDLNDLRNSPEQWKLYPNDRNWRVKYKVQDDPYIVLDFEIGSKDVDYRY